MSQRYTPQQPVRDLFDSRYEPGSDDRNFVTALARGFDIIRAFRSRAGSLGNTELAEITGLPKPTVSRLTYTLCQLGYLQPEEGKRKYKLSVALLALAYPVLSSQHIRQLTHERLAELATYTQCNIALAMPNTNDVSMVYLDCFSGSSVNTLRTDTGMRISMAHSAIGRAYLAGLPSEQREAQLARLEEAHSESWAQLEPRIEGAISEVTARGFCLVDGEWMSGTRAVAVPLVTDTQGTVMALSCGAPSFAISQEQLEQELGPRLLHVARSIEALIKL